MLDLARKHRRRKQRKLAVAALLAGVLSTGLAGCGGSTSSSTSSATTHTSSTTSAAPAATTHSQSAASVTTGPVRGALHAENHAPRVKQNWRYSVVASDAAGHPLSGAVDIEFVFAGQVVGRDTPPTHPVAHGHWQDTIQFPADAVGMPLTFQAVVHTRVGSITLDWPITVRR